MYSLWPLPRLLLVCVLFVATPTYTTSMTTVCGHSHVLLFVATPHLQIGSTCVLFMATPLLQIGSTYVLLVATSLLLIWSTCVLFPATMNWEYTCVLFVASGNYFTMYKIVAVLAFAYHSSCHCYYFVYMYCLWPPHYE